MTYRLAPFVKRANPCIVLPPRCEDEGGRNICGLDSVENNDEEPEFSVPNTMVASYHRRVSRVQTAGRGGVAYVVVVKVERATAGFVLQRLRLRVLHGSKSRNVLR